MVEPIFSGDHLKPKILGKETKTVEEAQVYGLVPGDCQGDKSTNAYRKAMNQNRKGYFTEKLISNAQYQDNHQTLK